MNIPGAEILEVANGSSSNIPYWSSSEYDQNNAFVLHFWTSPSGSNLLGGKTMENKVRAIRAF